MLYSTCARTWGVRHLARLSLIIPVWNEEQAVETFFNRIEEVRPELEKELGVDATLEFVFVNDGSSDRTRDILEARSKADPELRLVNLSRNFGKEAALSAGLRYATGDAVIPIDVDLQDPPEAMVEMVRKWVAGAHIVNARRADRTRDSFFKRSSASAFYALMERISNQPVHPHVGDFRLLDRKAVDALNQLGESSRYNKGLFSWIGFNVEEIELIRAERESGTTKWKPASLWSLALDGITSSSTLPLRIWTYLGAIIAFLAFLYATFLIIYTLVTGGDTPGYASIMIAILFIGGLNLLSLGLMGEYIGRIAIEVRRRPLYIVESTEGF